MPAPSQLRIATSSLQRLVKEEASYYKELEQQQARISKINIGDDENAEFMLKQEVCVGPSTIKLQMELIHAPAHGS